MSEKKDSTHGRISRTRRYGITGALIRRTGLHLKEKRDLSEPDHWKRS